MSQPTPTGSLSLSESFFAAMLADCPAFQTFCGVQGEADPVAAALARIHNDALPPPEDGVEYTREELEDLRPCALVWTREDDGWRMDLEAVTSGNGEYGEAGTLEWVLDWIIPAELLADEKAYSRTMRNHLGAIFGELANRYGQPGFLALRSLRMTKGPLRVHHTVEQQQGALMTAWMEIAWSNQSGGNS